MGIGRKPAGSVALSQESSSVAEEITVVVPTYNAAATIGETLGALARGTLVPRHVIVVDNNSTDDSAQIAESCRSSFESLIVIPCRTQGVNAARNAGAAAATTSHVVFTDADDRVEADWFEVLSRALPWDAVVCTLRDARVVDGAWIPIGRDHLGVLPHDFLPQICGGAAGVRRSVWEAVGRFDETYLQGSDDTEFFWRVMLAGFEVSEAPDAVIWYRMRPSIKAVWRQRWRHGLSDERLHREYRDRGWDVHFRRHQFRNLLSATKAFALRRIGFWEWYARIGAGCGALYSAMVRRSQPTASGGA